MGSENTNQIVSDRCIWCGEEDKLSRSHLIPQCIGGRFAPIITCTKCNNHLGEAYEDTALENALLSAACVKLGIKTKKEGYRKGRKTDLETGFEMKITDRGAEIIPGPKAEHTFVDAADMRNAGEYWANKLKRERPNWPVEPIIEFFNDPNRTAFSYAGRRYIKRLFPPKQTTVVVQQTGTLNPKFIFKMAMEFSAICGLLQYKGIRDDFRHLFRIDRAETRNTIMIDDSIVERINTDTIDAIPKAAALENARFEDFHYFVWHLTPQFVLYLEISLFNQVRAFYLIGKIPYDETLIRLLCFDSCFIFPIFETGFHVEHYPNLNQRDAVVLADHVIEARFDDLKRKYDK